MRRILTALLIGFSGLVAMGQNSTSSPYSIYGLGDLESLGFAQNQAMGGAKITTRLPYSVNAGNPALMTTLFQPTLEFGFATRFLTLHSSDGSSQQATTGSLRNVVIGIPVIYNSKNQKKLKRKLAFSLGLVPYSSIGYNIIDEQADAEYGSVEHHYSGEGGINRAFLSAGYDLYRDTLNQLSIGARMSYIFGPVSKSRRTIIPEGTNAFNTRVTNQINLNDLYSDFGLYYRRGLYLDPENLDKNAAVSVGLTIAPASDISATNSLFAASYTGGTDVEIIRDTIINNESEGDVTLPLAFGFGLGAEINNKWMFALEYETQDWSKYLFFGEPQTLSRVNQFIFGMQHTPDYKAPLSSYLKRISYRGGFRVRDSRLLVKGESLVEYGINFGVALPMVFSGSYSTFNFGVEVGQRGNGSNNLIREQFTNLTFGFSFTPSRKFDPWFYQRKID